MNTVIRQFQNLKMTKHDVEFSLHPFDDFECEGNCRNNIPCNRNKYIQLYVNVLNYFYNKIIHQLIKL